ncbi:MAG: hypothetical protein ACUVXI_01430 [bacterium]
MKILLIQSSPLELLLENLNYIKRGFAGAETHLIVRESVKDRFSGEEGIAKIYSHNQSRIDFFKFDRKIIRSLRRERFDVVFIQYNDLNYIYYLNVVFFALMCFGRRNLALDIEGGVSEFGWGSIPIILLENLNNKVNIVRIWIFVLMMFSAVAYAVLLPYSWSRFLYLKWCKKLSGKSVKMEERICDEGWSDRAGGGGRREVQEQVSGILE